MFNKLYKISKELLSPIIPKVLITVFIKFLLDEIISSPNIISFNTKVKSSEGISILDNLFNIAILTTSSLKILNNVKNLLFISAFLASSIESK